MKTLLLTGFLFISGMVLSQEYTWVTETNPDYETAYKSDVIMHGGKLYQAYDSVNGYLDISVYDPATMTWTQKVHTYNPESTYGLQTEIIGDEIYIAILGSSAFVMYRYDISDDLLTQIGPAVTVSAASSNWNFIAGDNEDELYIMAVDNGSNIMLHHFISSTGSCLSYDNSSVLNPTFSSTVSSSNLELYVTVNEVYMGVSGGDNRIGFSSITDLTVITPYNSAGSNDGSIYIDGSVPGDAMFYFTGNSQDAPNVNVRDNTLIKTWQVPIGPMDIDISSTGTTAYDFNITPGAYDVVNAPSNSFLVSNFVPVSGGTANKFYVYTQPQPAPASWDSVGPKLEYGTPLIVSGSLRIALDFPAQQHLAVQYATNVTSGASLIKVLNRKPAYVPASVVLNSGLCGSHLNELYPQFELYDADNEGIRILNVTSQFGTITGMSAVASGLDLSSSPSIAKFKIYGTPGFGTNDAVIITYTDGWSIITDTLPIFMVTASAPNIVFYQTPLVLCDNENLIELESYVSYSNAGVFTLNGQELDGSTINGITESVLNPSGTLYYRVNVDGCFVETGVTFSFAQVGTASSTATPATCGTNDGTAAITFSAGTSPNVTFEWSTGESTASISGLAPGAYYYGVTDEYGCHTTGFASVASNGLTVTPTVTNSSCAGANDGSISVVVAGAANYSVLWSTGHSTDLISNLAPGNYEVTVQDGAGCQVTYSQTITEPAALAASFTSFDPDCGVSNGEVYGTYSGGSGSYSLNWLGNGQTGNDLTGVTHGYYEVEVTDLSGCTDTFGYQLNDYQSVAINDSVIKTGCTLSNGAILVDLLANNGGNPASAFSWSNGNAFEDNFNLAAGTYTITAQSISPVSLNTCYAEKTMTVGIKAPVRQEICLVTVDLNTSTNLVIWEDVEFGMDRYHIYRENAVAGNFMLIDSVDGDDDESLFNDVVASPLDRSWRYKITAVNTCGIEGPFSTPHKTLHLNSIDMIVNGTVRVYWDDYEGQTAAEYVVHRYTDQAGWEALSPAVPFGTSEFTDLAIVGATGLDYYVEMVLPFECTAEKAQDFNSSRSNKDKAAFSPGEGTGDSNNGVDELNGATISVYPNPFSDLLTVNIANASATVPVSVYGVDGHLISEYTLVNGIHQLDLSFLQSGMYFIRTGSAGNQQQFVKL